MWNDTPFAQEELSTSRRTVLIVVHRPLSLSVCGVADPNPQCGYNPTHDGGVGRGLTIGLATPLDH